MPQSHTFSAELLRAPPVGAIECYYRGHFLWYLPLVLPLYRVGRREGNELLLDDPTVSARHALLTPFFQELLVEDLESKNGVIHRGKRIARAKLTVGESVQIGLFTLSFVAADPQRAAAIVGKRTLAAVPLLVMLPEGKRLQLTKRVTRLGKENDASLLFINDGGRVLLLGPQALPVTVNDQPVEGVVLLREGDRIVWQDHTFLFTFSHRSSS